MGNASLSLVLLSLMLAAPAAQASSPQTETRRNVVFIMSDQHNARALGCYGNQEIRTPNLDRLAGQGTLFTRAICQTGQCVPSRYSIWTGRYARSHGTYSNGNAQNPRELTVAELFKAAGYATATFGKHHMVMGPATANHGFDVVEVPAHEWKYNEETVLPYDRHRPGQGGRTPARNEEHDAVGCRRQDDRIHPAEQGTALRRLVFVPWPYADLPSLWLVRSKPNGPCLPSSPDRSGDARGRVVSEQVGFVRFGGTASENVGLLLRIRSQIDHNIGLVLDELDRHGLADHYDRRLYGRSRRDDGRAGAWTKGSTGYEATMRVPLILRLAGVVPAGKRIDELACSIDLFPTLLETAGLEVPSPRVQGKSLLPWFKASPARAQVRVQRTRSVDNQVVTVTSKPGNMSVSGRAAESSTSNCLILSLTRGRCGTLPGIRLPEPPRMNCSKPGRLGRGDGNGAVASVRKARAGRAKKCFTSRAKPRRPVRLLKELSPSGWSRPS